MRSASWHHVLLRISCRALAGSMQMPKACSQPGPLTRCAKPTQKQKNQTSVQNRPIQIVVYYSGQLMIAKIQVEYMRFLSMPRFEISILTFLSCCNNKKE